MTMPIEHVLVGCALFNSIHKSWVRIPSVKLPLESDLHDSQIAICLF